MKSTRKTIKDDPNEALAGVAPPPQRRPLSPVQAIDKEFEYFCQQVFPEQWNEPDDQLILRTTFHAAWRQAIGQVIEGLKPMHEAAHAKFQALRNPPPEAIPGTTVV